jgi:predicted amidohydrolase YtcJ
VILSEDTMTVPEEESPRAKVLSTSVDGKLVYQKQR